MHDRVERPSPAAPAEPASAPQPEPAAAARPVEARGVQRLVYRAVGGLALALAAAGVALPLLPTTPFLLVAVWAFARGSPAFGARLYQHPRFGPFLRDWEARRAIPVKGKIAAAVGIGVSWTIVFVQSEGLVTPVIAGLVMAAAGGYVLTRPS